MNTENAENTENTENTECIDVFLEEKDIFLSVPKEVIKRDKKILNFIFNNLFSKIISSSLCLTLLLPRPVFATYQKDRRSNSQCTQIERNYDSRPYAGLVIDFRPKSNKKASLIKKSQIDNLKPEIGFAEILKIKKSIKIPSYYIEDFKPEKIKLPSTARYATLPNHHVPSSQKIFSSSSLFRTENRTENIKENIKAVQRLKSVVHIRGGYSKFFSLSLLTSKLVQFIDEKISDVQKETNLKKDKLRDICLNLLSFLILLMAVLFLIFQTNKVNLQIILQLEQKMLEMYKVQQELQQDFARISSNILSSDSAIQLLSEKVNEAAPISMSSKTFKSLWVKNCKKMLIAFIMSQRIPEVSEFFEQNVEDVEGLIEELCNGDIPK